MQSKPLCILLTAVAMMAGCVQAAPRLAGPPEAAPGPGVAPAQGDMPGTAGMPRPATAPDFAAASRESMLPLAGRVDFPITRSVAASVGDVINFATVSLIDTSTNRTVAATVTNSNGGFTLSMGGFVPEVNTPYLVEAYKGLDGHSPGAASPRFRTIVKYDGAAWLSITAPTVVISNQSTAVAIEAGLYPNKVPPGDVMGAVNVSVKPAGFNLIDVFNPTKPNYSGHPVAELVKLAADIQTFLLGDVDPVQSVPEVLPSLTDISIDHGRPKDLVTLNGKGFSPLLGGNTVTFNGVAATVLLASPIQLIVSVPEGASTGQVLVKTNRGTVPTGRGFTVDASGPSFSLTLAYPNSGPPGTDVTLLGFGFSKTPSENTVSFGGATTTCVTSDVTFCTCKVPADASAGPVSVKVGSATSNTLPFTVQTAAGITAYFPNSGAPGEEVVIDGSNLGSSGAVDISGVAARILKWTDSQVMVEVPTGTVTGTMKLTPTGRSAATVGNFTVLSGNIAGWTTITPPNSHNGGAWFARKGRYLYGAGGYANGAYNDKIDRLSLNSDGTAGVWTTLAGITNTRLWHGNHTGYNISNSAVVIGNYAYIYGGYDYQIGTTYSNTILRATIFADGAMSSFAVAPVTMATGRSEVLAPIRAGDYVYLVGGHSGCTDAIDGAKVNSDGTLQAFSIVGRTPTPMYGNVQAVVKNWLYIFGGYECASAGHRNPSRIYRAPLGSDGSLAGSFSDVGALPRHLYDGAVAIMGTNLYLFWGYDADNGWTNHVYRTTINANGDLGAWASQPSPSYRHIRPTLIKVGSRLYYTGNYDGSSYQSTIDVATIQ